MKINSHIVISKSFKIPISELVFRTSRSSGPGGQNVNKLETRVELLFDLLNSPSIPENIRKLLLINLKSYLNLNGLIQISCQESRSQWKNKQIAIEKLIALLKSGLILHRQRFATKPTKSAKEARLKSKKIRSRIKHLRRNINDE